ncbi:class I adenylate-forming enzyme family protein [Leisingera daeponensis]|uniref:class I adenylate-forming enzyme family protein n=1 Tax=Leisingera daeponensis TaxID=405746 RepID=UPI001C9625D3|nr:class I adenylate-forming enzyme family protein [Leisingera daeponensis]MBY6058760.1 acyl--CoA ligase [Leisingera daeponensis]
MASAKFTRHSAEIAETFISQGHWQNETLCDLLDDWAAKTPDRIFAREAGGRAYTFRDLSSASKRFANALLHHGLQKGDVIAVQLPSSIEFMTAYFGVTRMGGILATMHMPYEESELRPLLEYSGARAVICAPADEKRDRPGIMDRLRQALPELEDVIVASGSVDGDQYLRMADMIATGASGEIADPPTAADAALLCFTSGTSSAPKAVMHACETLLADAHAYTRTISGTQDDHSMIAPPFTHIFGLECVNNSLCVGGSVVMMDQFTPRAFAEMLEHQKPTIVYGAPAHLAATLRANELDGRDLSSVRHVILGGALCAPTVASEFEDHLPNGKVGILFGMTESLLVTQTDYASSRQERHGTVGRPIAGVDVRIVDPDGNAVLPGVEGELQLRGFTIMSGYVGNEAANAKAFTADGWLKCGDMAMWDAHGNVVITGRSIDVINRGGVKINPSDIEAVISEHPDVVQVALIPKPDDILGERICAVLTMRQGKSMSVEELSQFLEVRQIAKMRHPEHLVILDDMPMTPTKKIIKSRLSELVFPAG